MITPQSFIKSDAFRVVTGEHQGKPAWWFIKLDALKEKIFEKDIALGKALKLERYGTVLAKGYGDTPSDETIETIKANYLCAVPDSKPESDGLAAQA